MHRYIKYGSIAFVTVGSALAIAGGFDYTKEDLSGYNLQPNLRVTDDSEYSRRNDTLYFYAGYLGVYRFLSTSQYTVLQGSTSVTYVPKEAFPSNLNGFEVGVGRNLTRYIELQVAYLQELTKSKTSVYLNNTFVSYSRLNGVLGDVGFVFNPDDAFQVVARAGAVVGEFYNTTTFDGLSVTNLGEDKTRIEPAAGMDFIYQFSENVAFRVGALYVANTHRTFSRGEVDALAALSYTI